MKNGHEIQVADVKDEVREYWNEHPCGTQFTGLPWGSKEFFEHVEKTRYEIQPFMHQLIRFDRYGGKEILEIGCGLGTDLLQFARAGARVTGIDITPKSIELVRKRFAMEGLPVDVRVADAEQLPFKDNSFDVVYSFGVLHHTPDTQKAIDEAYRLLRPGGEIIIMLYHRNSLHVMLGAPLYLVARLAFGGNNNVTAVDDWIRRYDGSGNPLGKAYTKAEIRTMFRRFQNLSLEACDPIRRRFPTFVNALNQRLFASRFGFYLIIRGNK